MKNNPPMMSVLRGVKLSLLLLENLCNPLYHAPFKSVKRFHWFLSQIKRILFVTITNIQYNLNHQYI